MTNLQFSEIFGTIRQLSETFGNIFLNNSLIQVLYKKAFSIIIEKKKKQSTN